MKQSIQFDRNYDSRCHFVCCVVAWHATWPLGDFCGSCPTQFSASMPPLSILPDSSFHLISADQFFRAETVGQSSFDSRSRLEASGKHARVRVGSGTHTQRSSLLNQVPLSSQWPLAPGQVARLGESGRPVRFQQCGA